MQKTGAEVILCAIALSASDLERWKDADSRIRKALGLNVSDLLQELFPFSEGEARLW